MEGGFQFKELKAVFLCLITRLIGKEYKHWRKVLGVLSNICQEVWKFSYGLFQASLSLKLGVCLRRYTVFANGCSSTRWHVRHVPACNL